MSRHLSLFRFGQNEELRCPRELALKLGAIEPRDVQHHKQLQNGAAMLVRDPVTLRPMFWPLMLRQAALKSSD